MTILKPQLSQKAFSHLQRAQALQTAPFTYNLPSERIANHPLPNRHDSNLLVVPRLSSQSSLPSRSTGIRSLNFRDLPSILPSSSLIIRNATRVIPARIPAHKSTGGRAEILLLHPTPSTEPTPQNNPTLALSSPTTSQSWRVILGGRNLKPGDTLSSSPSIISASQPQHDNEKSPVLKAEIIERHLTGEATVSLTSDPPLPLRDVLSSLGLPPLPPYIRRPAHEGDRSSFQTVYASHEHEGSAAAPTAGLHVTSTVMDGLQQRGIDVEDVVLHIGTATFRQVNAEVAGGHDMHQESIAVSGSIINKLISHITDKKPVVALGTTSVRTIESLYWFGVRLITNGDNARNDDMLSVDQWEPYFQMDRLNSQLPEPREALSAVLDWCGGPEGSVHGGTNLLIVPGYPFMITKALITNFHQPRSTLLMLVSAFYGGAPGDLEVVYRQALDRQYRFLSYGDSSIYADADFFAN